MMSARWRVVSESQLIHKAPSFTKLSLQQWCSSLLYPLLKVEKLKLLGFIPGGKTWDIPLVWNSHQAHWASKKARLHVSFYRGGPVKWNVKACFHTLLWKSSIGFSLQSHLVLTQEAVNAIHQAKFSTLVKQVWHYNILLLKFRMLQCVQAATEIWQAWVWF